MTLQGARRLPSPLLSAVDTLCSLFTHPVSKGLSEWDRNLSVRHPHCHLMLGWMETLPMEVSALPDSITAQPRVQ